MKAASNRIFVRQLIWYFCISGHHFFKTILAKNDQRQHQVWKEQSMEGPDTSAGSAGDCCQLLSIWCVHTLSDWS